ncbi:MAG: cysteine desulfurase family protein [Ignavibacteria bacterium]|nr:cysteine desulfurase family protein [Ignavibacteria bacterium]
MIYLDNNSTTRLDDRVLNEMIPFFVDNYANASSRHVEGINAKKSVELARKRIGDVINANKDDIYFTSGSTEAINTIFKGVIETNQNRQKHIITVKTEHSAVIEVCRYLEKKGVDITYLNVDKDGLVNINELRSSLRESTVLVSVMLVNNEIGVIQNIGEISELLKEKNVLFFTDATQGFGKIPIDIKTCHVDFMCFSGHKIHGPKGIGGIYINENRMSKLEPLLWGGGQENNFRGGTSNVPAIVGFGLAAELACSEMEINEMKIKNLRDTLEDGLIKYNWVGVNGKVDRRTYNVSNLTFKDIEIEPIINGSLGIIASNSSACSSGSDKPSHVLKALGLSDKDTFSSIRFSLSKYNSEDEIIKAIGQIDSFIKSNYSHKSINY